jgi:hypothetical protein
VHVQDCVLLHRDTDARLDWIGLGKGAGAVKPSRGTTLWSQLASSNLSKVKPPTRVDCPEDKIPSRDTSANKQQTLAGEPGPKGKKQATETSG